MYFVHCTEHVRQAELEQREATRRAGDEAGDLAQDDGNEIGGLRAAQV
jgi:hypothetical protein